MTSLVWCFIFLTKYFKPLEVFFHKFFAHLTRNQEDKPKTQVNINSKTSPSNYLSKKINNSWNEMDANIQASLKKIRTTCPYKRCNTSTKANQQYFKMCSQCKIAHYCSKDCQKKDWKKNHKKICVLNANKPSQQNKLLNKQFKKLNKYAESSNQESEFIIAKSE